MRLRRAEPVDTRILYEWANDRECRVNSFSPEPIPYEVHQAWVQKILGDPERELYILEDEGIPVGQLRLEQINSGIRISYSIGPQFRGKGYGTKIIELGEQKCRESGWQDSILLAEVKQENRISQKIFESLSYQKEMEGNRFRYWKKLEEP